MARLSRRKQEHVPMDPILEEKRKEDRKMVRGIFRFHEVPKGQMDFNFRAYPGDPVEKFSMKDGEVYEVPLGVAKHLNKNCWYPIYGHNEKAQAAIADNALLQIKEKVRRCSFQSLDFIETK